MTLNPELQKIHEERGKKYGVNPLSGFKSLGKIWRALLEDHFQINFEKDIPPHLVSLMMAGLKLSRAARPWGNDKDNYNDAQVYVHLALEMVPSISSDMLNTMSPELWDEIGLPPDKAYEDPRVELSSITPLRKYKCIACGKHQEKESKDALQICDCGSIDFIAASVHIVTVPGRGSKFPIRYYRCNQCGERFPSSDGRCSCGSADFTEVTITFPEPSKPDRDVEILISADEMDKENVTVQPQVNYDVCFKCGSGNIQSDGADWYVCRVCSHTGKTKKVK